MQLLIGEMSERFKVTVLKTVEGQPSVGSNPTLSEFIFLLIHSVLITHALQ